MCRLPLLLVLFVLVQSVSSKAANMWEVTPGSPSSLPLSLQLVVTVVTGMAAVEATATLGPTRRRGTTSVEAVRGSLLLLFFKSLQGDCLLPGMPLSQDEQPRRWSE